MLPSLITLLIVLAVAAWLLNGRRTGIGGLTNLCGLLILAVALLVVLRLLAMV